MIEYLELSCVPAEEEPSFPLEDTEGSRKEAIIYKHQLQRLFPKCTFKVKSCPHDFGTYYDVCVIFDDQNEEELNNAYNVDANIPMQWDDIAKNELKEFIQSRN